MKIDLTGNNNTGTSESKVTVPIEKPLYMGQIYVSGDVADFQFLDVKVGDSTINIDIQSGNTNWYANGCNINWSGNDEEGRQVFHYNSTMYDIEVLSDSPEAYEIIKDAHNGVLKEDLVMTMKEYVDYKADSIPSIDNIDKIGGKETEDGNTAPSINWNENDVTIKLSDTDNFGVIVSNTLGEKLDERIGSDNAMLTGLLNDDDTMTGMLTSDVDYGHIVIGACKPIDGSNNDNGDSSILLENDYVSIEASADSRNKSNIYMYESTVGFDIWEDGSITNSMWFDTEGLTVNNEKLVTESALNEAIENAGGSDVDVDGIVSTVNDSMASKFTALNTKIATIKSDMRQYETKADAESKEEAIANAIADIYSLLENSGLV